MEPVAIDDDDDDNDNESSLSLSPFSTESQQDDGIHRSVVAIAITASNHRNHLIRPPSLSRQLRILFALNGATLQLPSLALLSIVNDRVAIPPEVSHIKRVFFFYFTKSLFAAHERHIPRTNKERKQNINNLTH